MKGKWSISVRRLQHLLLARNVSFVNFLRRFFPHQLVLYQVLVSSIHNIFVRLAVVGFDLAVIPSNQLVNCIVSANCVTIADNKQCFFFLQSASESHFKEHKSKSQDPNNNFCVILFKRIYFWKQNKTKKQRKFLTREAWQKKFSSMLRP